MKYKASKKIDLSLGPQLRWDQDVSRLRNRILDLDADYDLPDGYKVGVSYRIAGVQRNSGWQQRQRIQLGGSKTWKEGDFRFAYQSRIQFSFDKANERRDPDQNSNFRNKLKAEYKGVDDFTFGTTFEFFHGLKTGEFLIWQDWRLVFFGEYKVNKDFDIKLGYLVQNQFQPGIDNRDRVLVFGFSYSLN